MGAHTVYVVHWPGNDVMKVGCSSVSRWRAFTQRGADVVKLYEFQSSTDAYDIEEWLHQSARTLLPPAFESRSVDARILLGHNGDGYMECYQASLDDVQRVIAHARSRADAQADAQASGPGIATYERNGRDGLTQTRRHLPEEISPQVTRARTYGNLLDSIEGDPVSDTKPDLDAIHETICDNFTGMREVRDAADALVAYARTLEAERDRLAQRLDQVRALHRRVDNPRYGWLGPEFLCSGHGAVTVHWPCATVRVLDGDQRTKDTQ